MQDLLEYFYSHFKTKEDFNKKYGMFAPIVEGYLETLVSYKFIKTKEPIDKLLKTNIKLVVINFNFFILFPLLLKSFSYSLLYHIKFLIANEFNNLRIKK